MTHRNDRYEAPWIHEVDGIFYMSFMMDQKCPGAASTINGASCPTGACAPLNCSWAHYGSDLGYAMSKVSPVSNYTEMGSFMWSPPFNCGLCSLQNESASLCNATGGDNSHHGMVEYPRGSGHHYLAYHTRKLAADRGEYKGYQRNIALDRLYVILWKPNASTTPPVFKSLHYPTIPHRYLDHSTTPPVFRSLERTLGGVCHGPCSCLSG